MLLALRRGDTSEVIPNTEVLVIGRFTATLFVLAASAPAAAQSPYLEQARSICAIRLGAPTTSVVEMNSRQGHLPTIGVTFYSHKFVAIANTSTCAVDLDSVGREVDSAHLIAREVESRESIYGRLKPEQHAHLAELPDRPILATIWARRPTETPVFFQAADPFASKKDFTAAFMRTLVSQLMTQFPDSEAVAIEAAFAVQAKLTPTQIRAVARWTQVDEVMADAATELLAPEWYGTHRLGPAHQMSSGVAGGLGRIGVIETGIWQQHSELPIPTIARDGMSTDTFSTAHVTMVVGVLSNTTLMSGPGTAPGGKVFYAASSKIGAVLTQTESVSLLLQAPASRADVLNMSFYNGIPGTFQQPTPTANREGFGRYCDEQAYDLGTTFVAGAGNWADRQGLWQHVASPANGLNVIAVGMFDDKRSPDWETDATDPVSHWKNPPGIWNDRSKPDLLAAATDARIFDPSAGNRTSYQAGTSFATPMVTGTIGLMNDYRRNSSPGAAALPGWNVRAILLATALNNVDRVYTPARGSFSFPWTHLSELDGAGGMDSAAALQVLASKQFKTHYYSSCEPAQSRKLLPGARFDLRAGQRARAAITWASLATPLGTPTADLDVLVVRIDPVSGASLGVAAWSGSMESNAEMVEFTAELAGTHQLFLLTRSCSYPYFNIGYAWWLGP